MDKFALVTGSNGAIGTAIGQRLQTAGYRVCGLDQHGPDKNGFDLFIQTDLNDFVHSASTQSHTLQQVTNWLGRNTLDILVNNAAYQYVSTEHPMPAGELSKSYNINLIAPYLLITHLASQITHATGSVINIGSIHARLTKPGFVAYATTKGALAVMTRGLALDYADQFRINCIEPASIETPMLLEGFAAHPEKQSELAACHPQKRIGTPEEVAELVLSLSASSIRFLHGACIDMSGGIASKLHDPV